jgi:hypothetical protein
MGIQKYRKTIQKMFMSLNMLNSWNANEENIKINLVCTACLRKGRKGHYPNNKDGISMKLIIIFRPSIPFTLLGSRTTVLQKS